MARHVPWVENGGLSKNELHFNLLPQAHQKSDLAPRELMQCLVTLDLQWLKQLARDLINNLLAPSTRRAYAIGQRRCFVFRSACQLTPFPLTEDQLCTFVAHLVDEGLQHSSIKIYLLAIRWLQIIRGLGDLFAASWLAGVHNARNETSSGQAQRYLAQEASAYHSRHSVQTGDVLGEGLSQSWFHNAVGSSLHFFGFLWSGEMTVSSMREYDPEGHLIEGGVSLDSQGEPSVVWVHIKASKTDPFRLGVYVYLGRVGCGGGSIPGSEGHAGLSFHFVSGSRLSQ